MPKMNGDNEETTESANEMLGKRHMVRRCLRGLTEVVILSDRNGITLRKLTSVNNSFAGLGALTSVSIPASVETVGREAFSYCNKLAEVTIEEGGSPLSFDTDVFGQTQYLGTLR